ncbi:SDR family oxidoreductase [Nocardia cerradoensis]|uniref:3-oxoacyl-[acyl-carrier-protein] reductase MabA n=1 Tax=Nocardia cerradoensis TaxID=85688 RepID=A0A231HG20_9NOCA|nr:SDR family oxidoreductase [Nocardia cerradoensis]NKY43840.1 SDR family oxidoreductase [Nocardia cerradoensis]OXR47824.1 3-oxoacyl-[acyl-carrier-protein] reductase FabG [Nocardia cerradoensis]
MYLGLENGVALVTAASRGIGRATAERLAAEGMTVIAAARSAGGEPETVGSGSIVPFAHDLGDAAATAALVDTVVSAYGAVDVVVLNTPGPRIVPALEAAWDDWTAAHDTLLRPVVQLATAAGRVMRDKGAGAIILLSSTWVRQPAAGGVLSAAYRSAASAFVKNLASELAPAGVRVNQIMPGATGTDRMQGIVEMKSDRNGTTVEEEIARVVADIPAGRWAEASEIADAVAFLASARASFITGTSLSVDGGAVRAAH